MTRRDVWHAARKILCVRLDALGDVLMTTPALRALKEGRADRHLTLLSSPAGLDIAQAIPEIDDAIVYEAPWMKATRARRDSDMDIAIVDRLRGGQFDAAVIFTVYSQNPLPAAFLCQLAGIPLRLAHCRENPYSLLSDWSAEPEPDRVVRHEVRRQLDLVASIGCTSSNEQLSLYISEETSQKARTELVLRGIDERQRWVLIHPGASAPSRRYPPESFTQVADILALEHDCTIVFTGTPPERELVQGIRGNMTAASYSVAGELSLLEFAAFVQRAPLLISNNTGPAHIAAAVGTPVVDLYALTNPQHTPWGVPSRVLYHDVPCKFCYKSICPEEHHDCLRRVTPERVVQAACELLDCDHVTPVSDLVLVP